MLKGQKAQVLRLHDVTSEHEMLRSIQNYLSTPSTELLVLQCDPRDPLSFTPQRLDHVKYLFLKERADFFAANKSGGSKSFLVLIHLPHAAALSFKPDFQHGWFEVFIDDIAPARHKTADLLQGTRVEIIERAEPDVALGGLIREVSTRAFSRLNYGVSLLSILT